FRPTMTVLLRRSLLLLALAGWVAPLSAAAARTRSSAGKPAAKKGAVAKASHPGVKHRPSAGRKATPARAPPAGAPAVSGKVAVFEFKGDDAALVHEGVVGALRARGLAVTTSLRPVDSAEQYREMAATLDLAAYVDGAVS